MILSYLRLWVKQYKSHEPHWSIFSIFSIDTNCAWAEIQNSNPKRSHKCIKVIPWHSRPWNQTIKVTFLKNTRKFLPNISILSIYLWNPHDFILLYAIFLNLSGYSRLELLAQYLLIGLMFIPFEGIRGVLAKYQRIRKDFWSYFMSGLLCAKFTIWDELSVKL